jgi:hypothetical protein
MRSIAYVIVEISFVLKTRGCPWLGFDADREQVLEWPIFVEGLEKQRRDVSGNQPPSRGKKGVML